MSVELKNDPRELIKKLNKSEKLNGKYKDEIITLKAKLKRLKKKFLFTKWRMNSKKIISFNEEVTCKREREEEKLDTEQSFHYLQQRENWVLMIIH
ncbi:hypothetical protein [Ureaplasma canigenitalium]|uniref:hypothetical protein n=1 Tax=Ureaplasma canigenitalium TaxID=42092 RepID=UPI0004E1B6A2|nr:hypothetical protein [Ureaplasma canigenitalium]